MRNNQTRRTTAKPKTQNASSTNKRAKRRQITAELILTKSSITYESTTCVKYRLTRFAGHHTRLTRVTGAQYITLKSPVLRSAALGDGPAAICRVTGRRISGKEHSTGLKRTKPPTFQWAACSGGWGLRLQQHLSGERTTVYWLWGCWTRRGP